MAKEIILNADQQAAVRMVHDNQFAILSGKPGTGKTTVTKAIIEWAESQSMQVLQCAPTGKAAKRMTEATDRPAATIHSTLGCVYGPDGFEFVHGEDNPLPADLLIVDECSMINNNLMADFLRAVDPIRTKVLMVGDPGQLPSIGAGAILRDLIESGKVPVTELKEIQRNSGEIVLACAAIHAGELYQPAKQLDLEAENPVNLIHIECMTPEKTLIALRSVVCDRMPLRGYDPVDSVQVISPVNIRGPLSCKSINELLQNELNPPADDDLGLKFRPGDKVINTKNEKVETVTGHEERIVNGDIGRIIEINQSDKEMVVKFTAPDRTVLIPLFENNLLHAYAITCHRFQGSESPVIIIPVHTSFGYFTNKRWIYTAISRAREICITIGNFSAIEQMIHNRNDHRRVTRLQERLHEEAGFGGI